MSLVPALLLACFAFFAAFNYLYAAASLLPARPAMGRVRPGARVAVVIASYNEREVIEDTVAACEAMTYPDRTIVIGDDSDDPQTVELLRTMAKSHHCGEPVRRRYDGVDVEVYEGDGFVLFHRERNAGYKGGNLRALGRYLHERRFEYMYLLDADWRPDPDAIQRCLPVIEAAPDIAFVQTKRLYYHDGRDHLARCLAMNEEACYLVDLPGRQRLGHMVLFSGCCALFRLSHLDAVGGFRPGHLTEDLDLSNRLYLAGYRGVYLDGVANVGEVPPNYKALRRQQERWACGSARAFAEHLLPVLGSPRLSARVRLSLLRQNAYYTVVLVMEAAFAWSAATALAGSPGTAAAGATTAVLVLAPLSSVLPLVIAAVRRRRWLNLVYLPAACWIALSLVHTYALANLKGLAGAQQPWNLTPKTNRRRTSVHVPGAWSIRLLNAGTLVLLCVVLLAAPGWLALGYGLLWGPALLIGALAS